MDRYFLKTGKLIGWIRSLSSAFQSNNLNKGNSRIDPSVVDT